MKRIPVRQIANESSEQGSAERFRISGIADLFDGGDLIHELHRHDFYFILALEHGEGLHEIDFRPYAVSDYSFFFLRPGQVHQLMLKEGATGYLAEFNTEFYHPEGRLSKQRLLKASHKDYCRLDKARFLKLHSILARMLQEYAEKEEGYGEAIRACLELLNIELIRQSPDPDKITTSAGNYAQSRLEEFLEHLETRITSMKQASQYAQLMNLTLFQLNGITRSTLGRMASELINEHIILEAKRYLIATANQVKDIAYHLGYEDVSYFIRYFKKHTGQSPEAFRQSRRP